MNRIGLNQSQNINYQNSQTKSGRNLNTSYGSLNAMGDHSSPQMQVSLIFHLDIEDSDYSWDSKDSIIKGRTGLTEDIEDIKEDIDLLRQEFIENALLPDFENQVEILTKQKRVKGSEINNLLLKLAGDDFEFLNLYRKRNFDYHYFQALHRDLLIELDKRGISSEIEDFILPLTSKEQRLKLPENKDTSQIVKKLLNLKKKLNDPNDVYRIYEMILILLPNCKSDIEKDITGQIKGLPAFKNTHRANTINSIKGLMQMISMKQKRSSIPSQLAKSDKNKKIFLESRVKEIVTWDMPINGLLATDYLRAVISEPYASSSLVRQMQQQENKFKTNIILGLKKQFQKDKANYLGPSNKQKLYFTDDFSHGRYLEDRVTIACHVLYDLGKISAINVSETASKDDFMGVDLRLTIKPLERSNKPKQITLDVKSNTIEAIEKTILAEVMYKDENHFAINAEGKSLYELKEALNLLFKKISNGTQKDKIIRQCAQVLFGVQIDPKKLKTIKNKAREIFGENGKLAKDEILYPEAIVSFRAELRRILGLKSTKK